MKFPFLLAVLAALAGSAACDKKSSAPKEKPAPEPSARAPDAGAARPATGHAGPFEMIVTPATAPVSGTPASLTLELLDAAGARVTSLDVVHEKIIHLIVVSPDLSFFAHVHPEAQPDGRLQVTVTPPHPATYVVFGDFRPTGGAPSITRATFAVEGEPPATKPLVAKGLPARGSFDGFEVSLRSKAPLVAGADAMLEFEISENGAPVADLRDYLGARGHCVIISEDTTQYLHTHPLGGTGSKIEFHTSLPKAGKYKVWAEFRPAGKPVLASFVIDVPTEATAPAEPHDHGGGHDHGDDHGHSH